MRGTFAVSKYVAMVILIRRWTIALLLVSFDGVALDELARVGRIVVLEDSRQEQSRHRVCGHAALYEYPSP